MTRHASVTCVWTLHGHEAGTMLRDPGTLPHPRFGSRLWICYDCGATWATECMLDGGLLQRFEVLEAPCGCTREGLPWHDVPGSLTMPTRYPLETFDTLPPALRRYETHLLLEPQWQTS